MADTNTLASRIDAQFMAVAEKVKQFQTQELKAHKGRQQRLEKLGQIFEELGEIWKPKLDLLLAKFGERVKVTPRIVPGTREATFDFRSSQAHVRLKLSAYTDMQVEKLILSYDLDIVPVLMKFTSHAELEFPLSDVKKEVVAKWIDDRIVDFVQTYLSLGDSEYYLKDLMVEDPIAHVRFPNIAAACNLEWGGQKYYFISDETRQEFARKNNITVSNQGNHGSM